MPTDMNTPVDSGMQALLSKVESLEAKHRVSFFETMLALEGDLKESHSHWIRQKDCPVLPLTPSKSLERLIADYEHRVWFTGQLLNFITDLIDDIDGLAKSKVERKDEIERLRFERDELQHRLDAAEADKYEYERRMYEAQADLSNARSNRGGYDYD
jgi:hypothetical protein